MARQQFLAEAWAAVFDGQSCRGAVAFGTDPDLFVVRIGNRILRVLHQVVDDLPQLAGVAHHRRGFGGELGVALRLGQVGAPVGELLAWVKEDENRRKGEMVLIVEGFKAQEEALPADALRTLALLQAELPLKKAAALAAEIHGVKKNALYKYALEQQGE